MNKLQWCVLGIITLLAACIRLISIESLPPGLYIDEVSSAHNAYSILTTGKDEYGVKFPLWFEAFGEYKMPVMIYLISGSMALFGKTDFAVRLPTVLAGILTIPAVFFLVKQTMQTFVKSKKFLLQSDTTKIAFFSALCLAVSPWHIHFSRGGFEATIALLFVTVSIYLFLKYLNSQSLKFLLLSVVFGILATYTYNTYRIIVPLICSACVIILFLSSRIHWKHILITFIIGIILFIPVIQFSLSPEGSARFAQTSAFSEYKNDSFNEKIHLIPMVFLKNYLSFFSTDFLFNSGDYNGRHQVPGFGLFFKWQSILCIVGVGMLITRKYRKLSLLLVITCIIMPIPAALTVPSPHSLRSLGLVVPFSILCGIGVFGLLQLLTGKRRILLMIFSIGIIGEVILYTHHYIYHYPRTNILDWGAQYKNMVYRAETYKNSYDYVIVDQQLGHHSLLYFNYYGDSLVPQMVDSAWKRPQYMEGKKVLLIRPDYHELEKKGLVDSVKIPNLNQDTFAEFYSL